MGGDKGKKAKVADGAEPAAMEDEGELVHAVEKLQEIQDELEKINEEASDKVLEVEQKYNEIRRPVYNKRNEVIQSIPDFWITAFLSHPVLGDLLNDEDHKIFKHLKSIDVEDSKDVKSGFSITFNFSSNPFFEDTKLTKTFSFSDEGLISTTCSPIKWKEGMDICNGDSSGKKGKKRPANDDSFFNWFSEEQKNDVNYDEIAEIIKDDLWPNPLKYFNNEADEEDEGDEDGDEEKGFDEDEDDGEEDEDDDDEDDN